MCALKYETCVNSINALLENGGRLIDTAYMYHNEDAVGDAVRNAKISSEEIFVTVNTHRI